MESNIYLDQIDDGNNNFGESSDWDGEGDDDDEDDDD